MNDERIVKMYKQGSSIDYITKVYHKYKNRNLKPIVVNGITLYPSKVFTKSDCRLYVCKVIYHYLINGDLAHTS